MPPTSSARPLVDVVNTKLDNMGCDIQEIKAGVKDQSEQLRAFQIVYTREHEKLAADTVRAHTRIDQNTQKLEEHEKQIQTIDDLVKELSQTNKILKWVLGILTAILTAVLVGIVTGQVQVVFP